ncbi:MAG: LCP family protein [Clostridia bacterium]|nr:LCP family protein [Clostridia bacterium]
MKVEVNTLKRRRKKAKKNFFNKKRLTIFGISFAVLLTAFFVVMGMGGMFFQSDEYAEEIVEPVDKETGKVNALLAGVDKSGLLTDTIMVASYDLDNNVVNILSVPRDTRMYIGNKYQKINSAHSISKDGKKNGINGTIEAVTRLTGIPINYYIEFTFNAFRETIDALGGVYFDVPQNMNYDDPAQDLHIHLQKGYQLLDGDKAEQFVRFRRYPMGDIDRVAAQQAFVKAVAEQKLNASIIPKLPELFKTLQENLKTNITLSDVTKYIMNIAELKSENVYMHSLPGVSNGTDYGSSYWIADMDELAFLIENTFGYDASKITIHSADGKSVSKDVKKTTAQPTSTPTQTPKATEKATASPKPTEAAKTPKPTTSAEKTATPTKTPSGETSSPSKTAEPTKEPEPTAKATQKPAKTPDSETEGGIKRPAANPTAE